MARALSVLLLLLSFSEPLAPLATAAALPFPDMQWSWYQYRDEVQDLKNQEVIGGYDDGNFHPKDTINRAELLKVVFKGRSDVVPVHRRCFRDVNPDEWYAPYVCAAKNRGIVQGYKDNSFHPSDPVNFAEAIKIVLNAYGLDVQEGTGALWFQPYEEKLQTLEILPEHSYVPWDPLNRERAADLIWRVLSYQDDRVIPRLSPGCGKAPVAPPSSVMVNGVQRDFLLTVPSGYKEHDPTPLIVAFHGRTNSNEQVRAYMGLDRAAPDALIAYPAALSNGNGSFSWENPGDKPQQIRDLAFFDAIVEELADDYCVDMDRITVVGHSLGAWMANSVACLRGGVVMASATVGGDSVNTKCSGPSAAMIVHNPHDNLAPFSGAELVRKIRIAENACTWDTTDTGPSQYNCMEHTACANGNDVLWCPQTNDYDEQGNYYPHNWPKGIAQSMIAFFNAVP